MHLPSRFFYNQTWEDPRADLIALQLDTNCRVVSIASAGCNLLHYLAHGCATVDGVDLNPIHLHIAHLRLAVVQHLPDYDTFFRFFGDASSPENVAAYETHLRGRLTDEAREWWEHRALWGQRPMDAFGRGFYRHGWCGAFFYYQVRAAQLLGRNPGAILSCTTREEQRECFDREIRPGFRMPLLRHICEHDAFLAPLCIPPQQLQLLRNEDPRPLLDIFLERTRHLLCDFDIADNYFAWQACAQRYDTARRLALPDYLQPRHYSYLKENAQRISLHLASITEYLRCQPSDSVDRYVLLDAQDWMDADEVNSLWREILRTARSGARIIFRTLAASSPLERPAFDPALRQRLKYEPAISRRCWENDRSAIYGAFHLYVLN